MTAAGRTVEVPATRLLRWVENFGERHDGVRMDVVDAGLRLTGGDGERAVLAVPYPPWPGSGPDDVLTHLGRPRRVVVVAVRRGGYACAVLAPGRGPAAPDVVRDGLLLVGSKVGRRRVQGRTAAGGWSQQRYARRRDKQADELVAAVAAVARGLLVPVTEADGPPVWLVTGGDRPLVQQVLDDPHVAALRALPHGRHLGIGDPDAAFARSLPERVLAVTATLYPAPGGAGGTDPAGI